MGGIKVTKSNTGDTDLDSTLTLQVRKHGAVAFNALTINEDAYTTLAGSLQIVADGYIAFGDTSHSIDVNAGYMLHNMPANEDYYWAHGGTNLMWLDTSAATLYVGFNDAVPGIIHALSGAAGQAEGGELRLGTAADYDATYNYYFLDAYQDDLRIGRAGLVDAYLRSTGTWQFMRDVLIDGDGKFLLLKGGVTGTKSGIAWTFNSDTNTNHYAEMQIDYDTRATLGLHMNVGYPITLDATTQINFDLAGTRYATLTAGVLAPQHATGAYLALTRADSSIADGNRLGTILFRGDDPSASQNGAEITALADGTWSSGAYASEMLFKVHNGSSMLTPLKISSAGTVAVNMFGVYSGDYMYLQTATGSTKANVRLSDSDTEVQLNNASNNGILTFGTYVNSQPQKNLSLRSRYVSSQYKVQVVINTDSAFQNVANGTVDLDVTGFHIKDTVAHGQMLIEANPPSLHVIDSGGSSNDKWMMYRIDGGVGWFQSLNDDGSDRVDNILVMDMGTGNVGLRTDTPAYNLDIAAPASGTWLGLGVPLPGSGSTTFEGGMRMFASSGTDDRSWAMWADANNPRALRIEYSGARGTGFGSGTEVLRLDYQGAVTVPGGVDKIRAAADSTNADQYVSFIDNASTSAQQVLYSGSATFTFNPVTGGLKTSGYISVGTSKGVYLDGGGDTYLRESGNFNEIDFYVGGALDFRMQNDGDFHARQDIYAYSTTITSDIALKKNVTVIDQALDKVSQLRGVLFDWKDENVGSSAGLIAQDVEEVLPELVKNVDDPFDKGNYKALNYNGIIGLLVESIKELKEEITELKNAS